MKKLLFIASFLGAVLTMNDTARADIAQAVKVIVVDAGHGGTDPGAVSGGHREKDITLKMALAVGEALERRLPNVKVVYTRKTDKSMTLKDRIAIAHGAKGDLYVSIHVNSAASKAARGAETCIFSLYEGIPDVGRGSAARAEASNEAVLTAHHYDELVKNKQVDMAYINRMRFVYGEHSEALAWHLQQNYAKSGRMVRGIKRGMFQVLYGVDMPSVITEIGFLSNPEELQYMTSAKGQAQICNDISNAIVKYVNNVNGTSSNDKEPKVKRPETTVEEIAAEEPAPSETAASEPERQASDNTSAAASDKGFTVQIMASKTKLSTDDPRFKSRRGEVKCYVSEGVYKYKYCVGLFDTREAAQNTVDELAKEFGGAFVIQVEGDKVVQR